MIVVTGPTGTSEHEAAIAVRDALTRLWPGIETSPENEDLIRICAAAKISGYQVSDIDVLVSARLGGSRRFMPRRVLRDGDGNRLTGQPVRAVSFVAAIEVKDHDPSRVRITGDNIEVRYSKDGASSWSSATEQNIKQAHAIKSYFADQGAPLYVHRMVMMRGFTKPPCQGAIGGVFDGPGLLTALLETAAVQRQGREYVLRSGQDAAVDRSLAAPVFRQLTPSSLDRKRMDRLVTHNPDLDRYLELLGSKMLRFRGRGGTGKTVMLLQLAWRAFDQRAARSIVLTYNHALASDIRRLMALMNIPSDPVEGGVGVRTVMSFVTAWLYRLGLVDEEEWLGTGYSDACQTACEMIRTGAVTEQDLLNAKRDFAEQFEFDYVIADEAQDWPTFELELIKLLYSPQRICLADGIDQLVRGRVANWDLGVSADRRTVIPLTKCLRMKANLAVFANSLAERAGLNWKIEPNAEAAGGRVIVALGAYSEQRQLHSNLLADAEASGNGGIDALFCVPPSSVRSETGRRRSAMADTLEEWGFDVWDGVDPLQRKDFPRRSDTLRVVQYASCRGLEGWTVVLDSLDQFWASMRNDLTVQNALETADMPDLDGAAWRSTFIPLTRAIDTLVITLSDAQSDLGRAVLAVARQNPDVVELVT